MQEQEDIFKACLGKQEELKTIFQACPTPEIKYQKIIQLGRLLPPLEQEFKIEKNLVRGCQSMVYLHAFLQDKTLRFKAFSEALISSGLAYLLLYVYQGETPEVVLTCPPRFIEALGLAASLTPARSNGLASIYLHMRQAALQHAVLP